MESVLIGATQLFRNDFLDLMASTGRFAPAVFLAIGALALDLSVQTDRDAFKNYDPVVSADRFRNLLYALIVLAPLHTITAGYTACAAACASLLFAATKFNVSSLHATAFGLIGGVLTQMTIVSAGKACLFEVQNDPHLFWPWCTKLAIIFCSIMSGVALFVGLGVKRRAAKVLDALKVE